MKIISKFHDYYDTALGHGFDPHVIYERKEVEYPGIDIEDDEGYKPRGFYELGGEWHQFKPKTPVEIRYASWCLLFCGKPYLFYVIQTPRHDDPLEWQTWNCYTVDAVAKAIIRNKKRTKEFETPPKYNWRSYYLRTDGLTRQAVKERFKEVPKQGTIDALHRQYRAPAILVRNAMPNVGKRGVSEGLIINPVLKELGFQRAVDPYTAFQEISMYMGGVLGRPEMVHDPIPNDAMRDMKGFDEFSFKQQSPGQKKARRKLNRIRKQQ